MKMGMYHTNPDHRDQLKYPIVIAKSCSRFGAGVRAPKRQRGRARLPPSHRPGTSLPHEARREPRPPSLALRGSLSGGQGYQGRSPWLVTEGKETGFGFTTNLTGIRGLAVADQDRVQQGRSVTEALKTFLKIFSVDKVPKEAATSNGKTKFLWSCQS